MKKIAVLFAMKDSIYYKFAECDVYDVKRNALSYEGGLPIIAHPPCRAWGRLRHFSKGSEAEKEMALWAVGQVREKGGILEHPANSKLWEEIHGIEDQNKRGFIISIKQFWFGHRAEKNTKLYICGVDAAELPDIPFRMGEPERVIGKSRKNLLRKKEVTKRERSATPEQLALWLITVAKRCQRETK